MYSDKFQEESTRIATSRPFNQINPTKNMTQVTAAQLSSRPEECDVGSGSREWSTQSILAIFGGMICSFCSTGFLNAFGVFLEYYQSHQLNNKNAFDITWIGSLGSFLMFFCAVPAGLLTDKLGPKLPLCVGSAVTVSAIMMTSLCNEYYQFFLAQGVLLGVGMAFVLLPAVATIPKYFIKNRALALGIVISGSSLGGVVWPIMIEQLLYDRGLSFGWTMRVVGFLMIALLPLACFTLRPPTEETLLAREIEVGVEKTSNPHKMDFSIIRDLTFLAMCAGITIMYFGFFTPFFFITSYSINQGHSASISFYLVSVMNGASSLGRVIPGYLADRWGVFNTFIVFATFAGVISLAWTAAKSIAALVIWCSALGFTSGALLSLQSACAAQLSTPQTHGTAMGLAIGFAAVAGLFGSPISGALVAHGYLAVSMYTGTCIVTGTLLVIWSRLRQNLNAMAKV